MSFVSFLVGSFLFASSLLPQVLAAPVPAPVIVTPGTVNDIIITKNNTINATAPAGAWDAPAPNAAAQLPMQFVNYLGSANVKAYVTGLDANNQLVFLGPNGQFYYPSTTSSTPQSIPNDEIAIPLGGAHSTTSTTLPGYLSASRVYFSDGELQFFVVSTPNGPGLVEPAAVNPNDPSAALNWGFAELTWINNYGLYADISFVDFVGLPLGMQLTVKDGSGTQSAMGLQSDAVTRVCDALKGQQAVDGFPWGAECAYTPSNQLIRVLAPQDIMSTSNGYWNGYFDNYIKQVFQAYSTTPLQINTQAAAGVVNCKADMSSMTISCDGDNRPYSMPSAADIFGCNSGPFAIEAGDNAVHYAVVPRLCAAFNRGTLMIDGGSTQPSTAPSTYYTATQGVYNYFSKFVHQYESNNKGYAFAYDDVAAEDSENVSGSVVSGSPDTLTIFVGGYDLA